MAKRLWLLFILLCFCASTQNFLQAQIGATSNSMGLTARQVVLRIQKHWPAAAWDTPTLDTFKAGDPDTPVTGIVTTFTPTMAVLRKAVAAHCNFIISHEPTFYNNTDDRSEFLNDPVFKTKLDFIQQHHLVIWRFHDHWHHLPDGSDGILAGVVAAMGWQKYQNPSEPWLFNLPPASLSALATELQNKLQSKNIRVVGNPQLQVTRVALLPGSAGREAQVQMLERKNVQVLIAGESRQWETVEYARDAALQKKQKALILLGHERSEEIGMKQCALWLRGFISEVPIHYIPAGEPFWRAPK